MLGKMERKEGGGKMEREVEWFKFGTDKASTYVGKDSTGEYWVDSRGLGVSDFEIILMTGYDGTSVVIMEDIAYVPSGWAQRNFPDCRESIENAIKRINKQATEIKAGGL